MKIYRYIFVTDKGVHNHYEFKSERLAMYDFMQTELYRPRTIFAALYLCEGLNTQLLKSYVRVKT